MKKRIIFISGVHGVGKSTLVKKLASHFGSSISHESCSAIIEREKEKNWKQKQVKDIDTNQIALEKGVKKILANNKKPILLDGHFCLLKTDNHVERININIFKFLRPQLVILLVDEPEKIKNRINSRDDSVWNLDLIEQFQQEEKEYANKVCHLIDSNLCMVYPSDVEKAISKIENLYYG